MSKFYKIIDKAQTIKPANTPWRQGEWYQVFQVEDLVDYLDEGPTLVEVTIGSSIRETGYDEGLDEVLAHTLSGDCSVSHVLGSWNEHTQRLYAAAVAARVLPIFEAARPGDGRPRRAIEVARLYADGLASAEEALAAAQAAMAAADDVAAVPYKASVAAVAAAIACEPGPAYEAAYRAAKSARWAADDCASERAWQTQLLMGHLRVL